MPENSVTSYPNDVPSAVGLVGSLIWCLPLILLAAVTPSCETLPLGRALWATEQCELCADFPPGSLVSTLLQLFAPFLGGLYYGGPSPTLAPMGASQPTWLLCLQMGI